MKVPEKLINFRVYKDSTDYIGLADVTLPSLESMTETVSGAGIAGEVDSPTLGHMGSMETVLNWRTLEKNNLELAAPTGVQLDLRGAQQVYDSSTGKYVVRPVKVFLTGIPKNTELGKLEVGTTTDTANTLETTYIKVDVDGETVLEYDKYNSIYNVSGTDYLADVRVALGLN